MKLIQIFCLVSIIGCVATTAIRPAKAQPALQLPADIIFETWTQPSYPFLVRLNAQTLQWSLFYAKLGGDVHLIGWSPKGDMLAIFQVGQLCILTRAAKLLSCMEDSVGPIADSGNGAGGDNYLYTIAWSNDETKLYYITDMPKTGNNPQLLEADVATGKTLRVLYDQPDMDAYHAIPAPNGNALFLSRNEGNFIQFPVSAQNTVQAVVRRNLNAQLAPPAGYDVNSSQHPPDNVANHQREFCPFSPKNTYFTADDAGGFPQGHVPAYEFDVFTADGNLKYSVRADTNPIVPTGCPAWSPDESTLYFWYAVRDASQIDYALIYKYTPNTGIVEPYFTKPYTLGVYVSPLEVSPDGNYLLYEDSHSAGGGALTATVIGPNNTVATYPSIKGESKHPLWVPPLKQ